MTKLEGQVRIPAGCAIAAVISKKRNKINGRKIIDAMKSMHERSNGLGGGFAAYGIYPQNKDNYAFHLFFDNTTAQNQCEALLKESFNIVKSEPIPTKKIPEITNIPIIWRYFLSLKLDISNIIALNEIDFISNIVTKINTTINGAYVFSSGKNMGVFKAVGYPEDVGVFYKLDEYEATCWTGHGRYPTNTPGWWGGAHPFSLHNLSVVHNGEISSYDANRRFIEMFGYKCSLLTDTEVITYMIDFLLNKKNLSLQDISSIIAAPFWDKIEQIKDNNERMKYKNFRINYSNLLITGPFSIIVGFEGGLMALNDRLKLRSLVVAQKDDLVYIASEESAIRVMEPNLDTLYSPKGGEPIIIKVEEESI